MFVTCIRQRGSITSAVGDGRRSEKARTAPPRGAREDAEAAAAEEGPGDGGERATAPPPDIEESLSSGDAGADWVVPIGNVGEGETRS